MGRHWFNYVARTTWKYRGVNDAWLVQTMSLGKEGSAPDDDHPFLVANEYIAGCFAAVLRLPFPPFALMRSANGKGMFTTLHVNPKKDAPPRDSKPKRLLEADARLCTGIILFDVLIANIDRHAGNILVDNPDSPKETFLIDHDRAVFAHLGDGDETKRFNFLSNRLGLNGREADCGLGANPHCLVRILNTAEHFDHWFGWIQAIPDQFIKAVCDEIVGLNITAEQAALAAQFFIDRKRRIVDLVMDNKTEFPKIGKRSWALIA